MIVTEPMEELRKRFNPAAAKNVCATYLLRITGEGGGTWVAAINDGQLDVKPYVEGAAQPDCAISVSVEDLEMIISGKMSAMTAALSGILSVDGSLGMAMQLVPIFFGGA